MSDTPWTLETDLRERLGLSRDRLRELRAAMLTPGPDYRLEKNRVEISLEGMRKLTEALRLPGAVQTDGLDAPAKKNPPTVTLCVWRIFPKNRHIIEAYPKGTDPARRENIVNVQVRDSSRFTRFDNLGRPLEIQARHEHHAFYSHAGAAPKRKGRR